MLHKTELMEQAAAGPVQPRLQAVPRKLKVPTNLLSLIPKIKRVKCCSAAQHINYFIRGFSCVLMDL